MKFKIGKSIVKVWVILFLFSSIALSAQEQRVALVIGNGAYKLSHLRNPINDATDFASALQKLGFSVTLKINADQRSMENSMRDLGNKLSSGSVGLFYFAGHGVQVSGRNYLIPIGADIESEADVKYEAVDVGRVLTQMEVAGNSMNVIILDACRNNPYSRSFRSNENGLTRMDAPTGSILAYATAPGSVAADGTGRNGLYTSMLLKHIITPGLAIERVFKQVRIDVMKASAKKQIPWESSSLIGDFFFISKRGIAAVNSADSSEVDSDRAKLKGAQLKPEKDQNTQIAYIPKTSLQERSDPIFSLAIFPSTIEGNTQEFEIINSLKEIFAKSQLFFPKFSYYDLGNRTTTKVLDERFLPPNVSKNLRVRKSFFSSPEPNIELICKLGRKLNVDAVLFYSLTGMTQGNNPDYFEVFLINVKTKKLFFEMTRLAGGWDTFVTKDAKILTEKVFHQFKKDALL